MLINYRSERRGAVLVESVIALSLFVVLLIAIIAGGLHIMNAQTVNLQAQEATRWISTKGSNYQRLTETDSPTTYDAFQQAVLPYAKGMDTAKLAIKIEWIERSTGKIVDWDQSSKSLYSISSRGEYLTNHVRVTVTYSSNSGWGFASNSIQSVCERPMTN